jgi:3-oxoacyl-[acyl-carrier protein] reductase
MLRLNGRVAVVTGGSRGIGRAISTTLGRLGAKVVVNFSTSEALARDVVKQIEQSGGIAAAVDGNIACAEQAKALIDKTIDLFGSVDILVNNAGINRDNLLMRMKDDEWEQVIQTNLTGVFNSTRAAIRPMLRQRWGRIINLSSVVGIYGNAGQANYCASKAGVIGFTKAMAREVGSRGITVNAVAPGFIKTDMTDALPEELRDRMIKNISLGRPGTPEDVANVVAFLASDLSSYITGQIIGVDGGIVM